MEYKQIIIVRKDLGMSIGKICGQVSHASMAFLANEIKNAAEKLYDCQKLPTTQINPVTNEKFPMTYKRTDLTQFAKEAFEAGKKCFYVKPVDPSDPYGKLELCEPSYYYEAKLKLETGLYEKWIAGSFTKVVLEAKNKNKLLKAKELAEEIGLQEGTDFFLIKDNCWTELTPEEIDEDGIGRTLTCIGFRPMSPDIIDQIGKKFQLYK